MMNVMVRTYWFIIYYILYIIYYFSYFTDFSLSKLLMNSRTFLVESIDANSRILHKLTELCIITNTQKEEIQSMKSTSDKNTKLLSIISQKPFKCFYLFLSALVEDNQSHVLDKLSLCKYFCTWLLIHLPLDTKGSIQWLREHGYKSVLTF